MIYAIGLYLLTGICFASLVKESDEFQQLKYPLIALTLLVIFWFPIVVVTSLMR